MIWASVRVGRIRDSVMRRMEANMRQYAMLSALRALVEIVMEIVNPALQIKFGSILEMLMAQQMEFIITA
jgi:hypothetical protein